MGFSTLLSSVAVLMLISSASPAVRIIMAERCPTAPGAQCRSLCLHGPLVKNIIQHINTCLNQTTTWIVRGTNPMIIIPHTKDESQGFKKTFAWRQCDGGPPGKTMNECGNRYIPRQADAEARVKTIKQQTQGDAGSSHLLSTSNRVEPRKGNPTIQELRNKATNEASDGYPRPNSKSTETQYGNPKIQEKGKQTTAYEHSTQHEHLEEKLCIPEREFLIYKPSDSSNQQTHNDEVKKQANASCGKVEGLCPSMTVLNCLAGMQAGPEHEKSNIDALDSSKYRDGSVKIRIESLGDNYELTKDQLDQLKGFTDIKSQVLCREKPLVVHVEDRSTDKTTKFVIVKEIGNIWVGVPYSELCTNPGTITTPRPTTKAPRITLPCSPPECDNTPPRKRIFGGITKPRGLIGRAFFPYNLGSVSIVPQKRFVEYVRPHGTPGQPYPRGYEMTEIPKSVPNFETTQLPTLGCEFRNNQPFTDRPFVYNRERCTDTGSWITEETDADDYDNYQDDGTPKNAATTNEGYTRQEPQSYFVAEGNLQSTTNSPKSLAQMYQNPLSFNQNGETQRRFQMNSKRFQQFRLSNLNITPYSCPMPQMGARILNRAPREWPSVRRPERLQQAKMPDYLTNPQQKYIPPARINQNYPKIFEHDVKRGVIPKDNQPTYGSNPNWVQKADFLPLDRTFNHRVQTYQTPNRAYQGSPPLPLSYGGYCDSYGSRVYPRPIVGYTNPIYNTPRMNVC